MKNIHLTDRQLKILYSIIDSFLNTAQPIGSRTLSKNYSIGVSPATIRNEMSDLEDMGFLTKSHVSSGRIPSDFAYRVFVDHILDLAFQKTESSQLIPADSPYSMYLDPEKVVKSIIKMLSQQSQYTVLGMVKKYEDLRLKHIEMIKMDVNQYLLITIYDSGDVNNSFIYLKHDIDQDELKKINFILNSYFIDLQIPEIQSMISDISKKFQGRSDLFQTIYEILSNELEDLNSPEVYHDGLSHIFDYPEYQDITRAIEFIRFIEDKNKIRELFEKVDNKYLNIQIGAENDSEILRENTVISSTYFFKSTILGKIMVIAPTRMDYQKTIDTMIKLSMRINNMNKR